MVKNRAVRREGYQGIPGTFLFPIIKGLMLFNRAERARTARDKAHPEKEQRTKALGQGGGEHKA